MKLFHSFKRIDFYHCTLSKAQDTIMVNIIPNYCNILNTESQLLFCHCAGKGIFTPYLLCPKYNRDRDREPDREPVRVLLQLRVTQGTRLTFSGLSLFSVWMMSSSSQEISLTAQSYRGPIGCKSSLCVTSTT